MIILNKVFLDSPLESLLSRPVLTCCGFSRSKQPGRSQSERWCQGQYWVPREPGREAAWVLQKSLAWKPGFESLFYLALSQPGALPKSQPPKKPAFIYEIRGDVCFWELPWELNHFLTGGKGAGHNFWKNDRAQGHNINQLKGNGSKMTSQIQLNLDPQSAS